MALLATTYGNLQQLTFSKLISIGAHGKWKHHQGGKYDNSYIKKKATGDLQRVWSNTSLVILFILKRKLVGWFRDMDLPKVSAEHDKYI